MHRAFTLDCPTGKRTRTGYTTFGPHQFAPAEEAPAEAGLAGDRTSSEPRRGNIRD